MAQGQRPESLTSVAQKISNQFVLVERSVARSHEGINHFKLVNETQRFELWARNLGLYHLGHSSLDYRFRDAPSIFEYTIGLLRNLEALLVQRELCILHLYCLVPSVNSTSVMNIVNPGRLASLNAKGRTDTTVQSQEQFSDDSEEDDFESSDDESITDLLLSGMAASIDKLYRLSFKIRSPAMRLGFSKALKYRALDPETGVDLMDQFRETDQRHLEQLFSSYLQRLAKANTRRRQQFGYWMKRRAQFEIIPRIEIIEKMAPDAILREPENEPYRKVPLVPITFSKPSTATHLDVSKVKLDDEASMISSSTVLHMPDEGSGDLFSIPPPPKHLLDGEEFECPYCFILCPRKMLRQEAWLTHILRDLRPYVCTYEDCKDADQQYDSLSDWINHETSTHQSESNIASNMKGEMSIQASRKCPFCLEDAGSHHVAMHLRRVACFSLPRSAGDKDDGSLQGSQISGRAEIRSNNTRDSETRSQISELISQADPEVNTTSNSPLTVVSLQQQRSDPNDEESRVSQFLERLEGQSADSLGLEVEDTSLEWDVAETDDSLDLISSSVEGEKAEFHNSEPDAIAMAEALSHITSIDARRTIIRILPPLSSDQILDLRNEYKLHIKIDGKGVNMAKHIRQRFENSTFGMACYATALGRWGSEAYWVNRYYQLGTSRRELVIESLFGRSNAEILEIKGCLLELGPSDGLEKCMNAEIRADEFQSAILIALKGERQSPADSLDENLVQSDVLKLHQALASPEGGETTMINIIIRRSDPHLQEVLAAYVRLYHKNFVKQLIAKSQSVVVEALIHILNGVVNRPLRDALLLHQALRQLRTGKKRSELLISRLVRLHWEPRHLEQVKSEFRRRYGEGLEDVIADEILTTPSRDDWGEFCLELARSSKAMHADPISAPPDNVPPTPGSSGATSFTSMVESQKEVVNSFDLFLAPQP
ncbi:hypothetical protein BDV34DRAFT_196567 [Aspergillus parasiticus]|uniref:Oxidoreductase acuF-like C2H2 type zinc-finger domain-containing protein n=1 Tax=Aspergillus parasiticus TaxID=5067 RepID=A0A5N6DIJ1_ASPPA|nr:hypothetical protein BDV34DRAFT_196567 [Aspergillus parasiticus]